MAALASLGFGLLLLGYPRRRRRVPVPRGLEWIAGLRDALPARRRRPLVALVMLTTVLSVVSIFYSLDPIQTRVKEYYAMMLLLMVGMLGVFVSLDLFLFYVFWEISLIPMYLVIGIWGGPRRSTRPSSS